jgi:hypothetical protein
MKKEIKVPYWVWNVYWFLSVLGAEDLFDAILAGLMLWVGYRLAREVK